MDWKIGVFILLILQTVRAQQTIWNLLQGNQNTTKFAGYIQEAQMTELLMAPGCTGATSDCLTLCAPNNAAIDQPAVTAAWAQMDSARKRIFITGHMFRNTRTMSTDTWNQLGQAMNLVDIGFGTGRLHELTFNTQRYLFQSPPVAQYGPNNLYFVGPARVTEQNLAASNGMLQVLDSALYTPDGSTNFVNYLTTQSDLTTSAQLWTILGSDLKYSAYLSQTWQNKPIYSTFFVVTNEAWTKVPEEQMTQLRTNTSLLASVLANHYLPNQLAFTEWTAVRTSLNFYTGFPTDPTAVNTAQLTAGSMSRLMDGTVTVTLGGSTATVQGSSSREIKQAVVHKISAPLGFVYETREQVLSRLNPQILTACKSDAACNSLLTNQQKLTIFAPTTGAMSRFNALTGEQKSAVLKYLFLPGQLLRNEMTEFKVIEVSGLLDAVRFRTINQNVFIESRLPNQGYVPVQLMDYDQMATNGVVHVIDGLPCIPYETVEQFLARTPQFSKFAAYGFVQNMTLGAPYTFCAPTNTALETMEASTTVGQVLLQDKARREFIFRRHTFPRKLLLEDLAVKTYDAATANYAFTREELRMVVKVANNWRVATINYQGQSTDLTTRTGSYEFTNGWLYTLDKILYTAQDLTASMCNQRACPRA